MINLNPGDTAFVQQSGFGVTRYTSVTVKKVTSKQIVIENGNRYRIEDGRMIGYHGRDSYKLVEPTEDVIKTVADFNIKDRARSKWDRVKGMLASPMHMDAEKAQRFEKALDEVIEVLQ